MGARHPHGGKFRAPDHFRTNHVSFPSQEVLIFYIANRTTRGKIHLQILSPPKRPLRLPWWVSDFPVLEQGSHLYVEIISAVLHNNPPPSPNIQMSEGDFWGNEWQWVELVADGE